MKDKTNKFYITTPIYYVNDKPHIGHAYTTIVADVLARFWRAQIGDKNVFFLTGTDEHGAKIAEAAQVAGMEPQAFTDKVSQKFKDVWSKTDISYDYFLRTTDKDHGKIVTEILKTLKAKGILYEDDYQGLYCVGCEKFITEGELVDGKCPDHNKVPQKVVEKNWFFKLSEFLPKIKKAIQSGELYIYPESRKNEVLGLIDKQHVPDFSISRSKKSVPWGIDLPWDENQKTYVWVDALSNYITALGYPKGKDFKKFWPADAQFMALDILKFHTLYWPAILMALDLPLPRLYIHGFFTIDGKKMSKTLGNVIDPNELADKYGAEVSKYLILSQFSFGQESDIKLEDFPIKYNADLVNGLGNLVSRVTNMIELYLDGQVGIKFKSLNLGHEELKQLRFREALLTIWQVIAKDNTLIDQSKPWELAKDKNKHDQLKKILGELSLDLYNIALALEPFMPQKSKEILDIITAKKIKKPASPLFPRL